LSFAIRPYQREQPDRERRLFIGVKSGDSFSVRRLITRDSFDNAIFWSIPEPGFDRPDPAFRMASAPADGRVACAQSRAVRGQTPTAPAAAPQDDGQWTMPAKNYAATRYSALDEISSANVKNLQVAFAFSTGVDQ
jgi:hypothetical protein